MAKEKKEEIIEEEVEESKEPKKEKKEKETREPGMVKRVANVIIWIIVLGWIAICVTDYIMTVQEKKPIFCISEKTIKHEDGNVYQCTGLGYKYFDYDRASYNATQFGGFWIDEHDPEVKE